MSQGDLLQVRCSHCRVVYWEADGRLAAGGDFKCRCGAQSVHFTPPVGDRELDTLAIVGNGSGATLAQRGTTAGLLAVAGVAVIAAGYFSLPYMSGLIKQGTTITAPAGPLPNVAAQQAHRLSGDVAAATQVIGSGTKVVLTTADAAGAKAAQDIGVGVTTILPAAFGTTANISHGSTAADVATPARAPEVTAATLAEASEPASPLALAVVTSSTPSPAQSQANAVPAPPPNGTQTSVIASAPPATVILASAAPDSAAAPIAAVQARPSAPIAPAGSPPPEAEPTSSAPARPAALGALYKPDSAELSPAATGTPTAAESNAAEIARLRASAALGNPMSQTTLSIALSQGKIVPRDDAAALQLLTEAAQHGLALAQNMLGARYQLGDGVDADASEAASWYRMAAVQGDPGAQYNLGVLEAEGLGVAQDFAEAYKWFALAARNFAPTDAANRTAAVTARDLAASHLSPAELDSANTTLVSANDSGAPHR